MNSIEMLNARTRAAQAAELTFPEPFFWTTAGLERLRTSIPDYRSVLVARALDALNALHGKTQLAAEGDSWFEHPCVRETMDWLEERGYAVYRCDAPGRLLAAMVREKAYLRFLGDPRVAAMLLSGGGNDLISWKRPSEKQASPIFKPGSAVNGAPDFLNWQEVDEALKTIAAYLTEFASDIRSRRPNLPIITHCYDRFVPRTGGIFGAWVGPQMDQIGVPRDDALRGAIVALLIDRANEAYRLACLASGMTFVDLRGTTMDRWFDEIHPNDEAFADIAAKLVSAIPNGGPPSRAPSMEVHDGGPGLMPAAECLGFLRRMSSAEAELFFTSFRASAQNDLVKETWSVTYDKLENDMISIATVRTANADDSLLQVWLRNSAAGIWIPELKPAETSVVEFEPNQKTMTAKLGLVDSKWTKDDVGRTYHYQLWGFVMHAGIPVGFYFDKWASFPGDA
jgi:hypothetical protein